MTTMMDKLVAALKSEFARQDKDWSWMDDKRGHIEISEGVGSVLIDGQGIIRAILTALKEPTEEMVAAAWWDHEEKGILVEEYSVSRCKGDPAHDTAGQVWQAMIEEAGK